jgi:hypothetical protein
MIKVEGRDLFREGTKIGYIDSDHIIDHSGEKVGLCSGDHVFDKDGHKVALIDGDYICFSDSGHKIRIEDNNRDVAGGSLSNIQRAAIRVLLGE